MTAPVPHPHPPRTATGPRIAHLEPPRTATGPRIAQVGSQPAMSIAPGSPAAAMVAAGAAGLVVLARAEWPVPGAELTQIAGFVVSSFNPLVAEVAGRCLRSAFGEPPAPSEFGATTAIVLASVRGDTGTADAVADAVRAGRRVPPLLFFQSNPNAVVGYVAARWGLAGPVVCVSPAVDASMDALADGLAVADLLITDGDATAALVIAADQADTDGATDQAVAVLVGRSARQLPGRSSDEWRQ